MRFAAKAVIFDLDGVLADSAKAVDRSWQLWAARHNVDPQRAVAIGHGRTTIEAIRIIAPDLDADQSFAEMEAFEASQIDTVVPVNGAPEFVQRIIELQFPWAVATSGTRRIALPRLQRARIPQPLVLITADDITRGKPHPEPYEKAAAAMAVPASDCVVFEDAPAGMLSARRAGARVIGIAGGYGDVEGWSDDAAADFLDITIERGSTASIVVFASRYRCPCCMCHTLAYLREENCTLCRWHPDDGYSLSEAQRNAAEYGVMFRPADMRFAPVRHPILGPNGEYAIDRVALRARAYREFLAFGQSKGDRVHLPERLEALLAAIQNADRLYVKP
jgi:sugar-phosphatase